MTSYKCDACGSCVCWCHPTEDWGVADNCMYDVGVPVNWRKARPPKPNAIKYKIVQKICYYHKPCGTRNNGVCELFDPAKDCNNYTRNKPF